MLNLANVFKFITNSLNQCTLAEKDFIRDMHQAVFHVLSQFGNQVNAVYKDLFKTSLGDVSLISEKFAVDLGQQVGSGQRISVINIPGSEDKIQDLSLVVDDKMHLQSKEPSYAAVSFTSKSFKNFVAMLTLDMAGSDWGRVDKGYASTFAQALCLKENNQWQKNRM